MLKLAITACIIAQVLSAPSGCTDLCGPVGGSSSQNEAFQNLRTLTDELRRDYNRPGNWTEFKDYKTHDGAGKVHEERGQMVNGNSQMRYYKKNYAASYGSGGQLHNSGTEQHGFGAQLHDSSLTNEDSTLLQQNNLLNSRNNYGKSSYNEQYHQSGRSSRIEDFGERKDAILTHESSGVNGQVGSDNWNRHNSYITDGGHGKVYEEEGQFTKGPAKVHYYKKNYTSSYSAGGAAPVVPLPDVSTNIETQAHQLQRQLEELSREVHQGHRSQVSENVNYNENRYQSANDNESRHAQQHSQSVYETPATGTREERYEEHSRREHRVQTHGGYVPSQTNYVIPDQMQTAESHQNYQHEVYRPASQVIPQTSTSYPTQDYQYQSRGHEYQSQGYYQNQHQTEDRQTTEGHVHAPLSPEIGYNSHRDESRIYSQHQQVRDRSEAGNSYSDTDRNRQDNYGRYGGYQHAHSQSGRRVEEQWNSSGRKTEESYPQQISSSSQRLEDFGTQQATRESDGVYSGTSHQGGNRYASGSSSSYHQRYESHSGNQGSQNGHFHTGVLDLGHGAADCDSEQHGSNYQRRYRRDLGKQSEELLTKAEEKIKRKARGVDYAPETQQLEDLSQLTQGFDEDHMQQQQTGRLELVEDQQQNEDLGLSQQTQQVEDLTQQSQGYGGYDQQYSGRLETGQHHQQQSGQLALNQQTQQAGDLSQQTQNYGSYRRQQQGQLQVGSQYQQQYGGESNLSQQTQQVEDLSQQNYGYGSYRQQGQSGRFNQHEQNGNFGVNQQNQRVEDLTQETQRYGGYRRQQQGQLQVGNQYQQQHAGESDLSQQSQQVEDLTQQNYGYGGYRQQGQSGQFNQQTTNLGLGQQTQQVEDLTQQNSGYGGYRQQEQSGRLNQQHQQTANLGLDQQNQQVEDLTQQNSGYGGYRQQEQSGRLNQQTANLGLDQQNQQVEDLTQQNYELDDFYQQNSGKLQSSDYHQQQQTGHLEYGQQHQHVQDSSQITQGFDYNQQQSGNLGYGYQQSTSTSRPDLYPDNRPNYGLGQEIRPVNRPMGVKGGGGRFSPQPSYNNQYDPPSSGVLSLDEQYPNTGRSGDLSNEKYQQRPISTEEFGAHHIQSLESLPESQNQYTGDVSTTPAPGFWKKVGQKITTGFEKVKAKVNDAFG